MHICQFLLQLWGTVSNLNYAWLQGQFNNSLKIQSPARGFQFLCFSHALKDKFSLHPKGWKTKKSWLFLPTHPRTSSRFFPSHHQLGAWRNFLRKREKEKKIMFKKTQTGSRLFLYVQQLGRCHIQGCTLSLKLKLKTHVREYSEFGSSKIELRIGPKISYSSVGELGTTSPDQKLLAFSEILWMLNNSESFRFFWI